MTIFGFRTDTDGDDKQSSPIKSPDEKSPDGHSPETN
jgi:hypothetical protein